MRLLQKPLIFLPGAFMLVSVVLTILATIMVIGQSGYGRATPLCTFLVYLAFWPSFLARLDDSRLFIELVPFLVNCLGWVLIGFAVAALLRKRYSDDTTVSHPKKNL